MTADPLSRYPAIRTSRVDEFEHQLRAIYGASSFVLPEPAALEVRGNFCTTSRWVSAPAVPR